jgi:hypothetical protein
MARINVSTIEVLYAIAWQPSNKGKRDEHTVSTPAERCRNTLSGWVIHTRDIHKLTAIKSRSSTHDIQLIIF